MVKMSQSLSFQIKVKLRYNYYIPEFTGVKPDKQAVVIMKASKSRSRYESDNMTHLSYKHNPSTVSLISYYHKNQVSYFKIMILTQGGFFVIFGMFELFTIDLDSKIIYQC